MAKNRHLLAPLRQRIFGCRRPGPRHRHDELVAERPMAGAAGRRRYGRHSNDSAGATAVRMEIACFKIPANLGAGLVLCSAPRLFVKGRRIQVPQWVVLLALLLAILFPAAGHADELTKQMCDAEAASMEQVAKDRDAKKPEAAAHAEQEGETDNKIISLIYQT